MTIARITAALGLVFAMLLGGVATATAATPAGTAAPHGTVTYTKVLAWHDDEVREKCPSTVCRLAGVLKPGIPVNGYCWTVGDSVTVNDVINYIWVRISPDDRKPLWVSAAYLVGGKYGTLSADDECPNVS
ncbi:hypothetical protein [Kutzneria chonburiensis]|uniref:SH3 domain-containing protein n=1 Tax=Kutzneria chonburiensis TaxID=1483604 RepID=A0ABV6MQU6_9PSEU|nr:hypothetical protein [Kutzneria chonburiensis]